jgi:cytochrome P450
MAKNNAREPVDELLDAMVWMRRKKKKRQPVDDLIDALLTMRRKAKKKAAKKKRTKASNRG